MNDTVTPLTPYRSDWHVERAEEQKLFLSELRFNGSGKRSIIYQGEGGIGKSWLFDWCWEAVRSTPGDRFYAQVNLDSRNDIVGWLEDIRMSFGAGGDARKDFGWGFGAFPRFDFALSLYSASRGGGDYVSPKFRRLIATQPGLELLVDNALGNAASKVIEPFAVSLGAVIKPLMSFANVLIDQRGRKTLAEDCADIARNNADSIVSILPRLLAQDIEDLCKNANACRFVLIVDGYERLLNSTAARGGSNNTAWLIKLHESLKSATVFIFSRYQIHWLNLAGGFTKEAEEINLLDDDEADMFGNFLETAVDTEYPPPVQGQYILHHRIPLFSRRQASEYLRKRNFQLDALGFNDIVESTRLPWELDLSASYLRENPLTSQAERRVFAKAHMLERMLEARPDGEIDLIRVMCFARSFTTRSVSLAAYDLGHGWNSAMASQFMNSSLVVATPDAQDRYRIDHHFADRLKDPTPDIAARFGLARRGDIQGEERLAEAAALLSKTAIDDLRSSRYELHQRIVVLNEILIYLKAFRARHAKRWSPETLKRVAEEATKAAREALLTGYRSEAQEICEGYALLFKKMFQYVAADSDPAAEAFRPVVIAWGVRFVELELETLARFSDEVSHSDFVEKVEGWQELLNTGATSKTGPFTSFERYWYARLQCRAHEFAFEMRTRSGQTENYYRRLGSSLSGHTAALAAVRQSDVPDKFNEGEREEHLSFLSQSLIWNASKNRRSDAAKELFVEALAILHSLASDTLSGKHFAVDYARALLAATEYACDSGKDREVQLRRVLDALTHAPNVQDFMYLETQEKAHSRLAKHIDARERSQSADVLPSEQLMSLVHKNVQPIAAWIEAVQIPPVPFAHLLLKSIRKSSSLLGSLFDGYLYQEAVRKSLKALASSSPEMSRSGYYELENIQNLGTFAPDDLYQWLLDAFPQLNPFQDGAVDSSFQIALAAHSLAKIEGAKSSVALEALYSAQIALNTAFLSSSNSPSYRQNQFRKVGILLVGNLCESSMMSEDNAQRVVEILYSLEKYNDVPTATRVTKMIRRGLNEGVWPKKSCAILSKALVKYLPQWGVDDYTDYVYFLRQNAALNGQLSKRQREDIISRADDIDEFLALDVFVGSRLAAAKMSHDKGAIELAIQLIFGAFVEVETFDKSNALRLAVRSLWAELVWTRMSDYNASARAEYRSAAKAAPEAIEAFAVGDKSTFINDILNLFMTVPRALTPISQEILVAVFDQRSDTSVDFGEDVSDYALLGDWEGTRLVSSLSHLAPKDEVALRAASLDSNGETHARGGGLASALGDAVFSPVMELRRLALVKNSRAGDVINVTCRGPDLIRGILSILAPKAIPDNNPRCRIGANPRSRGICVVATREFVSDALRGEMWFRHAMRDLLGVHILQFMNVSTLQGDAAVEREIKDFLKAYKHFSLVTILPSEAIFRLVHGREADRTQMRNFTQLFESVFKGMRARVEGYDEQDEVSEDLVGFRRKDLRLHLNARQSQVPPADFAEVLEVKYGRGGVRTALLKVSSSGVEIRPSRDVLHRSSLILRPGQLVFCTFGWNGRRVEVTGIERRKRPQDVLVAAIVDGHEVGAAAADLVVEDDAAVRLRLPLSLLREQGCSVQVGDRLEVVAGEANEVIFVVPPQPGAVPGLDRETNTFEVSWSGGLLKDCELVETHTGRKVRVGGRKLLKSGVMMLREGDRLRCTVSWEENAGTIHAVLEASRPNLRNVRGRIVNGGRLYEFVHHGETLRARIPKGVRGEPAVNGVSATAHIVMESELQYLVVEIADIVRRGEGRWYDGQATFRGKFYRFVGDDDSTDALIPFGIMQVLLNGVERDFEPAQIKKLAVRARLAETERGTVVTDVGLPIWNENQYFIATIDTVNVQREFIYLTFDTQEPRNQFAGVYMTPAEAAVHGLEHPIPGRRLHCTIKTKADEPVINAMRPFPGDVIKDADLVVASRPGEKGPIRFLHGEVPLSIADNGGPISKIARPKGRRIRATVIRVRDNYVAIDPSAVPDDQLRWQRAVVKSRTEKGLVIRHLLSEKTEFVPNAVLRLLNQSELEVDTMLEFTASFVDGRQCIFDLKVRERQKPWFAGAIVKLYDSKSGAGVAKLLWHEQEVQFQCPKSNPLRANIFRNAFVDIDLWSYRSRLSSRNIQEIDQNSIPWQTARLVHIEPHFAIADLRSDAAEPQASIYISRKLIEKHDLSKLQPDDTLYVKALPGLQNERLTALSVVYPMSDDWDGHLAENETLDVLMCMKTLESRRIKVFQSLERSGRVVAYEGSFESADWSRLHFGEVILGRVSERGSSSVLKEIVDFMGN